MIAETIFWKENYEALKAENAELKNRIADLTVLMMRYQELLDNVVKLREELDKALPI